MIAKELLTKLYIRDQLSMAQVADTLDCSVNKVVYWMDQHNIPRRTISDAVYLKANPNGDPFAKMPVTTLEQSALHGMGVGLYWGEGTKADKYAVRLGNSDPKLIKVFMKFLIELYGVRIESMKFGLQTFTDIDTEEALKYWTDALNVSSAQFYKVHVTKSGSLGTYRHKSKYGVATVYFHNKKLRDILVGLLPR